MCRSDQFAGDAECSDPAVHEVNGSLGSGNVAVHRDVHIAAIRSIYRENANTVLGRIIAIYGTSARSQETEMRMAAR